MASIQKKGERSYKITVCNGYSAKKKRAQSRTVRVPKDVPPRSILQYVYAQAESIEKRFQLGVEQDERTTFEKYAFAWLERKASQYKASTVAGYRRQLEVVNEHIGGVPLCKLRPMVLEELCETLRQRTDKTGKCITESTVRKYLQTISSVLEDARRNDILLYNPAHRVKFRAGEKKMQRIPAPFEMQRLLQAVLQEDLTYRVFYLLAIATGMRRGELCALRWSDLHGGRVIEISRSRSSVLGEGIVESDTKNHRKRMVVLPQLVFDYLGELCAEQCGWCNGGVRPEDYIFRSADAKPMHPDSFTRRLWKIYAAIDLPAEYHLHTLRHFFASYLLQNNVSKQVAADVLGHGDTAFLERTYCHPQLEVKQAAAGLLDALLAPEDEKAWQREQLLMIPPTNIECEELTQRKQPLLPLILSDFRVAE